MGAAGCTTSLCWEGAIEASGGGSAPGRAKAQDTKFWQEKMRFSRSSQTLFSASVHGDATLATQAVRSLGDPNCCSGTGLRALQVAISCGNSELVGLLLKAGADINGHTRETPPPIVLAAGNVEDTTGALFEMLLGEGADLTVAEELSGETALTRAADRGQSAIVRIILSRGTPGFQKLLAQRCRSGPQGDGATALHLAAGRGFLSICDRLLGVGADPSATDRAGRMPLHAAAEADRVEVANLLLTFGSLHSGQDKEGLTPLHLAMPSGSLTMTDVLVRFAADLNARCCRGQTVLHLAAKAGRDVVCQLLLAQGSEPNAVDAKGDTPFSLAFAEAHTRCCRALLDGGAEVRPVDTSRWVPPYTEIDPAEHGRLRKDRRGPQDAETPRGLAAC